MAMIQKSGLILFMTAKIIELVWEKAGFLILQNIDKPDVYKRQDIHRTVD